MILRGHVYQYKEALDRLRGESAFPYPRYMKHHRCIFIHVPKTGGSSIRIALGASEIGRSHLPWHIYYQANPRRFDAYTKIAFVRHPVERAYSAYRYLARGGNKSNDREVACAVAKYRSFKEFVEKGLVEGDLIHHVLFWPQSLFICDYAGRHRVDFLGKTETFERDADRALRLIGLQRHVPRRNSGNGTHSDIQLVDEETRLMLREIYRADFRQFGYE